MRPGEKLALAVVLGLCVLVCGTAGATAYAWRRAGSVRVAVHETSHGGSDFTMTLPGLFVNAAIALCPLPHDAELHARLAEFAPVLRNVASRLETLPDVVFVDARGQEANVLIEKVGSELVIRVVSPEELIELAVPIASVRLLMNKLDA